jgi:RNA polymerase sigma factor (TIGR02999 family)
MHVKKPTISWGRTTLEASAQNPVTRLLNAVGRGEPGAQDELWDVVYRELHALARQQMAAEPPGHTIQATSLLHEAYLRLFGDEYVQWANRRHFFAAAAQAMRRIRIDAARRRQRLKRGGGRQRIPIDEAVAVFDQDPAHLLAIDEALSRLQRADPRQAEVVLLRYFAGLSVDETANVLDLSPKTVNNDWRFARAWLHRELEKETSTRRGEAESNRA